MARCDFRTGEDVKINATIEVKDGNGAVVPIGNFNQIIFILYYVKDNVKIPFSWQALDASDPTLVAEATAAGILAFLHDFNLTGSVANMTLPKADTDSNTTSKVVLAVGQIVKVFANLSLTGTSSAVVKKYNDIPIGLMQKSVVEGLV
jgi:hypothetical protein